MSVEKNAQEGDFLAYTKEWSDPNRIAALFHNLPPSRQVDPAAWDYKLSFWENAIIEYCKRKKVLEVSSAELCMAFTRKSDGLSPRCIEQTELQKQNKVIQASSLSRKQAPGLASKTWSFLSGWVGGGGGVSTITSQTPVLLVPLLELQAQQLLKSIRQDAHISSDYVLPIQTIAHLAELSESDAKTLISFMETKAMAVRHETGEVCGARFAASNVAPTWDPALDNGVLALKHSIAKFEAQVTQFEMKGEEARRHAKNAVKSNQQRAAMQHLKREKFFLKMQEPKRLHIDNLTKILMQIQAAETTKETHNAYLMATATLRVQLKSAGKMVDEHNETVEDLQDLLHEFEDMQSAAMQPLDDDAAISEDIEEEYKELVAAEKKASSAAPPAAAVASSTLPLKAPAAASVPTSNTDADELLERFKQLQLPPQTNPAASKSPAPKLPVYEM